MSDAWPEPETDEPDEATLRAWVWGTELAEATDGCTVELDGTCPHGHPSWMVRLGLI